MTEKTRDRYFWAKIVHSESRNIGSATAFSAKFNEQVLEFYKDNGVFKEKTTQSAWDITGYCFDGPMKGAQLEKLPHSNHFAFAWLNFYPESEIYGE